MTENRYRILFFGTGESGLNTLETLQKSHEVVAVVTQPDAPSGRKMELSMSPIKGKALELDLPVLQPEKVKNNPEFLELIKGMAPDFIIVVAYGQIMPVELLDLPKFAAINIHWSILPKYRGASPIQQSLLNGDKETGISFIHMEKGLDSGPIYQINNMLIEKEDDKISLGQRLYALAALVLPDLLIDIADGIISAIPQDETKASHCSKIDKTDGQINWDKESAEQIKNKLRAFTPWPGIFTFMDKKRVKILSAIIDDKGTQLDPGQTHQINKKEFNIGTKKGNLTVQELQVEGKKALSSEDFLRGQQASFHFTNEME